MFNIFTKVGEEFNKGLQIDDSEENDIVGLYKRVESGDRRFMSRMITMCQFLSTQPEKRIELANYLERENKNKPQIKIAPDSFYSIKEFITVVLNSCMKAEDEYAALRIIRYTQNYQVTYEKENELVTRRMSSFYYSHPIVHRATFWLNSLMDMFETEIRPTCTDPFLFEQEKFKCLCMNMCNIIYALRDTNQFKVLCSSLLKENNHLELLEEGIAKLNKLSKNQKDKHIFVESGMYSQYLVFEEKDIESFSEGTASNKKTGRVNIFDD